MNKRIKYKIDYGFRIPKGKKRKHPTIIVSTIIGNKEYGCRIEFNIEPWYRPDLGTCGIIIYKL